MSDGETTRWVLEPDSQRGAWGVWVRFTGDDDEWHWLRETSFRPTHIGETPPDRNTLALNQSSA